MSSIKMRTILGGPAKAIIDKDKKKTERKKRDIS